MKGKRSEEHDLSAGRSDLGPATGGLSAASANVDVAVEAFLAGPWFVFASLLGVAGLTIILYGHTLPFPFVFDDWIYLIENPLVKEVPTFRFWTGAREFAALPAKLGLDPDVAVNMMLRPFTYVTFYLNQISNGNRPEAYRMVNIVVHAANGCLVFLVLRHIMQRSRLRSRGQGSSAAFIPLGASLIFVAHPLQIESVTYVIQRFTSLASFFFLLTLWLHLRAADVAGRGWRAVIRGISVVTMLLGLLSKEILFTLPPMAVLIDWVVMGTAFATAFRRAWALGACMMIIPALVLFATWAQGNGAVTFHDAMNLVNSDDRPRPHLQFFLNELRVVVTYLRLILVPLGQNLDPDIRPIENWADWRILASGAGVLAMLGLGWLVFHLFRGGLHAALIFAFGTWFFWVISISSGLVPLPDLMAEHRTYLPSVGAIVVLVCALDWFRVSVFHGRLGKLVVPAGMALWISALSAATLLRNDVWRSRRTLWEDTVAKSPGKPRPLVNLGTCHGEEGRFEAAADCFRKAIAIEPRHAAATENLTTILIAQKDYEAAYRACLAGLANGVDTFRIRHNLGLALCNLGHLDKGIGELEQALRRNQRFSPTLIALGQASYHAKRPDRAIAFLRRAIALSPGDREIASMLAELENESGKQSRAKSVD